VSDIPSYPDQPFKLEVTKNATLCYCGSDSYCSVFEGECCRDTEVYYDECDPSFNDPKIYPFDMEGSF